MKGSNSLILNEATMKQALQYWFDNVLFKESGLTVTGIKNGEGIEGRYTWTISITDQPVIDS